MLNHIVIMGRLVRDPELRRTDNGTAVARFTLAVDRDYASNDGGEKATDFIDCVAWRQTGEFVSKYFAKGRMAVVSGRLQIRAWTDKDGSKRKSAEIVADSVYFADSKNTAGGDESRNTGASVAPAAPMQYAAPAMPAQCAVGAVPVQYAPPAAGSFAQIEIDEEELHF